jgi:NTE family protein
MNYDLVLEGGGVKVPGLVGAVAAIEQQGFEPACIAGTSAGAIVASMYASGYTPDEMHMILNDVNFESFKDGAGFGRKIPNLLRKKGIYRGDTFYRMMQGFMRDKGLLTFGDLKVDGAEPKRRYKLRVFAADITRGTLVTWPDDAKLYGLDPDFLEVAWAVRTSMSIPYFFWPIRMGGSYFVDGGLLSNFPIWQFDSNRTPNHPTFGINLSESGSGRARKIDSNLDFLQAIIQTGLEAHDKRFIRPGDLQHRTIMVPVGDTKATDFGITAAQKEELYHSGYRSATEFLRGWRWEDYLEWAREARGIV